MGLFSKAASGLLLFSLFCSCKDEYTICDVNTSVAEKIGFYHLAGGIEQVAYAPSFTFQIPGAASPIYSALRNISKFTLPLNPLLDSAKYQISINSGASFDTITFVYSSQTRVINPQCGNIYVFNLARVSVTKHHLDSARIINHDINNVSGENVKIYF